MGCLLSGLAVFRKDAADVVAHLRKCLPDFGFAAGDFCRVGERPVVALGLAGEDGTGLVGVVAYGDHGLDFAIQEFVQMF